MEAAATTVAIFAAKQYSTVALQFLTETLSNTFWKSTAPDKCKLIREEIKHIVPLSEIQVIHALTGTCVHLRERSPLIETLLTNLNDEAAKIHHELHLIRLAILEYEEPWTRRPYYGVFSFFSRSLDVSENISKIKEATTELRRNFNYINQWIQTGITLDRFNRQIEQEQKTCTSSITPSNEGIEGTTTLKAFSPKTIQQQQPAPFPKSQQCLSSIQISDPKMIDKMYQITRSPTVDATSMTMI